MRYQRLGWHADCYVQGATPNARFSLQGWERLLQRVYEVVVLREGDRAAHNSGCLYLLMWAKWRRLFRLLLRQLTSLIQSTATGVLVGIRDDWRSVGLRRLRWRRMTVELRQVVTDRFSVVSRRPIAEVLAEVHKAIGHPNLALMQREVTMARTYAEMEAVVKKYEGPTGLMEFMRLDLGLYLSKGRAGKARGCYRLLVGNPLIMRRMAEHVQDVGSYAPVTILIDEREDGVHLSYDRMAGLLSPYHSAAASGVAEELDRKVEAMLTAAAE